MGVLGDRIEMEEQETQEMNKKLRIGVHHPRDSPRGYRLSPPQGLNQGIQNYRKFTTQRLTPKRYRIYKNEDSLLSQTKLIFTLQKNVPLQLTTTSIKRAWNNPPSIGQTRKPCCNSYTKKRHGKQVRKYRR
jgi:hypothetical protein